MTRRKTPVSDLVTWLGDSQEPSRDRLLETLDELYAAGPGEKAMTRAEKKLEAAMAQARGNDIYYGKLTATPVGDVYVALNQKGVVALAMGRAEKVFVSEVERRMGVVPRREDKKVGEALRQLEEYFRGERTRFSLKVNLSAETEFRRRVLSEALRIPFGRIASYGEIARRLGKGKGARAVGQALAHNPVPIVVPCHRVLGSQGALTGYSGADGVRSKARLLKLEGVIFE
jgi:methylated-DNA-[protein]-cysteine S-methyltransferase